MIELPYPILNDTNDVCKIFKPEKYFFVCFSFMRKKKSVHIYINVFLLFLSFFLNINSSNPFFCCACTVKFALLCLDIPRKKKPDKIQFTKSIFKKTTCPHKRTHTQREIFSHPGPKESIAVPALTLVYGSFVILVMHSLYNPILCIRNE